MDGTTSSVPVIDLNYNLADVATSVGSWFEDMWLVAAFATAIPLAFGILSRVKSLFLN